jgi:hypothetical protein
MTFTFDNTLATNLAIVRFEIGDTSDSGHYLEDETINYYLTNDSVGGAVIACLEYIITQLSQPNFRLDWLTVSNEQARAGMEGVLKQKRQKYGLYSVTMTASIGHAHRADSYEKLAEANEDGDYYTTPDGAP